MWGLGSLGHRQHGSHELEWAHTQGHRRMVEFVLSLADTLHLRFSISPLCETIRLARSIANPTCIEGPRRVWLRRRRRSVEGLMRDPDLRSFFALLSAPRAYHPDFLAPPPSGFIGDIQVELQQIRATPARRAEQEIARCLSMRARSTQRASGFSVPGTPPTGSPTNWRNSGRRWLRRPGRSCATCSNATSSTGHASSPSVG